MLKKNIVFIFIFWLFVINSFAKVTLDRERLQKRYDQRVEKYTKEIKKDPENPVLYYNLARTYEIKTVSSEIIKNYQKAISLNPKYFEAYLGLANHFKKIDRPKKVVENYQKALGLATKQQKYQIYGDLARVLKRLSNYEQAIIIYQKKLAIRPSDSMTNYYLAEVFVILKQYDKAIMQYKKTLQYNPKDRYAYIQLIEILKKLNRNQEAEKVKRDFHTISTD